MTVLIRAILSGIYWRQRPQDHIPCNEPSTSYIFDYKIHITLVCYINLFPCFYQIVQKVTLQIRTLSKCKRNWTEKSAFDWHLKKVAASAVWGAGLKEASPVSKLPLLTYLLATPPHESPNHPANSRQMLTNNLFVKHAKQVLKRQICPSWKYLDEKSQALSAPWWNPRYPSCR